MQSWKDSPGQSILRELETLHLRLQMTDLVNRNLTITNDTKTSNYIAHKDFFKGLSAVYGRWVMHQKACEGQSPDRDPLFPSVAPVDEHRLPKELVDVGVTYEAAIYIYHKLSSLSRVANDRLVRLAKHHPIGKGSITITEIGNLVKLQYVETVIKIAKDTYSKLVGLWTRHSEQGELMTDDIFCVVQRYETLMGNSPGNQMALNQAFEVLRKQWGVSHE